jgi:hypothetical protein
MKILYLASLLTIVEEFRNIMKLEKSKGLNP